MVLILGGYDLIITRVDSVMSLTIFLNVRHGSITWFYSAFSDYIEKRYKTKEKRQVWWLVRANKKFASFLVPFETRAEHKQIAFSPNYKYNQK